ncbi:MAG: hypothetical protein Q8Q92_02635 [bacterium]|nr:hypothetical protein [bacterium]
MEKEIKENLIHDTTESDDAPKKQGLEIGPQNTELQETLETLHTAVSHDQPLTESNLADLRSAVEGMKITIGGKELTLEDVESISGFNAFLNRLYQSWGVAESNLPIPNPSFVAPKEIEYEKRSMNPDGKKFGTYTLNPETFAGDFEKAKVFIPDLSAMAGKKLHKVFQYVVDIYGDKYHIPGIEYWKWMIENPDKAEEAAKKQEYDIKDGNLYFFPGSSLCSSGGRWRVPWAHWSGGRFDRDALRLEDGWDSNDRVLLLEK